MQTYKIHSVVKVADAQYGKKRIVFKLNEMGDKLISCFTKFPESIAEGKEIQGEIKENIKDGTTYYNFDFGSASTPTTAKPSSDFEEKVLNALQNIKLSVQAIDKRTEQILGNQIDPEF